EYPSYLPELQVDNPVSSSIERVLVNSPNLSQSLDSLDILVINGLHYCPVDIQQNYLLAARVAGFDEAVYGLPDQTSPLLFELPDYPVLVATCCLSRPITARYAPRESWEAVWEGILNYILPDGAMASVSWIPDVLPMYSQNETLPENYQNEAVRMGAEWFYNAKMILHESYVDTLRKMENSNLLKWKQEMPVGDGHFGSLEAIMSVIDENGSQPIGTVQRGDCIGETAMAMAASGSLLDKDSYHSTAKNLLNYYLKNSPAAENEWADPDHGAYGLIPWGITNYAWYRANYGDDNARQLMGIMVTSALTQSTDWDDIAMKCLLAQLRTTGKNGFRGNRIDLPDFERNGWEYYHNRDIINIAPHFESYLWACFLWAYDKTGYPMFLELAKKAIGISMEHYPQGWQWTNGLVQEKARMILCLSWLLRVDDSEQHRTWLKTIAYDLIALQDDCGAIREELGDLSMGKYPPPQSNDAYGTNEASLLGKNGDEVSDLLYTSNFAFLGLHEAAHTTKDPFIIEANNKLAEFLCRIQVKSPAHPEIHGAWFRAFDYGRFEHWGCNADLGWGAWCIESGWTQGWITTILALREMDTSIWDLTQNSGVAKNFDELLIQMGLPD
ncbi:MAG: hypothetical protein HOK84_16540, partial [Bacteroidetes bacterium]|nr:hypothetical protein [Bacteroidota bacterium]